MASSQSATGFRPLRVERSGSTALTGAETGAGPPLVLLHGLGGTWEYWGGTMALLAGQARCVALDLPGFGHSDAPPGGFGLDTVADELAHAMRTLGTGPSTVCGHSLGGPLCVRMALRHPDVVARVVLVGPSGLKPAPAWQDHALKLVPVYRALRCAPFRWEHWLLRVGPLRRAVLRTLVHDPSTVDDATARSLVDGGRKARELQGAITASFATGLDEEAARMPQPIGAIWGDRDRMVPPGDAEILRDAVPSADIRLLARCGHLPMVERPEAFSALLAELAVV